LDRATIENRLAQAERHIAKGELIIQRQERVVSELRARGSDTVQAETLLWEFQLSQQIYISDSERLRIELANCLSDLL
jgi:hypothetical protein